MPNKWLNKAQQILNQWATESKSIASMKVVNENAMDDGRQLRKLIAAALQQAEVAKDTVIKNEIRWCRDNALPDKVTPEFRDGFIKGLEQALFLIGKTP